MIATQSHDPRLVSTQRRGRGDTLPPAQLLEGLRHLLPRNVIVERRDGDVPAVDDVRPALVRVDVCARVEAAEAGLSR